MSQWLTIACAGTVSFALSLILTRVVREVALKVNAVDAPTTKIKTHKTATPCLGGVAISLSFFITLIALRLVTHFPTGTLYNLRGLFVGGFIIVCMGVIDDLNKPKGLSVKVKFAGQILAALALIYYGIQINFVQPHYISVLLSIFWTVGIMNAFNIIDIMDGFSSSQAVIAALAFLFIALPSEAIYVNFAAACLAGAALGFIPYNFSKKHKMFMGDSGSMFLGFILAALAMGTSYDRASSLGVYAPLLILAIPIYDTAFVAVMRMIQGRSPFIGSKDHYALRLEKMGLSRNAIVLLSAAVSVILALFAVCSIQFGSMLAIWMYLIAGFFFFIVSLAISKEDMHND